MTTVHRLETAAAQCFDRAVRDLAPRDAVLIVAGIRKGSGVHADFERAGVSLLWDDDDADDPNRNLKGLRAFENRVEALAWCKARFERTLSLSGSDKSKRSFFFPSNVLSPMLRAICFRNLGRRVRFDLSPDPYSSRNCIIRIILHAI